MNSYVRWLLLPGYGLLLTIAFSNTACERQENPGGSAAEDRAGESGEDGAQTFKIAGLVRGVEPAESKLIIEHEDVPGFMPSMTMPFTVKDVEILEGIKAGDAIEFEFVVTSEKSWIESIKPVELSSLSLPEKTPPVLLHESGLRRLEVGDSVPNFDLVDQKGRAVTLQTFKGKPLLVTFVFTRCPVPDFCPLISRKFKTLEDQIKQEPGLSGNVQLLSISIDPEYDTPEVLAKYAEKFTEDSDFWRFATGDPEEVTKLTKAFSVYVEAEDGTLNHTLCTALIDAEGKVVRIWRGNTWKPGEVLEELKSGPSGDEDKSAALLDANQGEGS